MHEEHLSSDRSVKSLFRLIDAQACLNLCWVHEDHFGLSYSLSAQLNSDQTNWMSRLICLCWTQEERLGLSYSLNAQLNLLSDLSDVHADLTLRQMHEEHLRT